MQLKETLAKVESEIEREYSVWDLRARLLIYLVDIDAEVSKMKAEVANVFDIPELQRYQVRLTIGNLTRQIDNTLCAVRPSCCPLPRRTVWP